MSHTNPTQQKYITLLGEEQTIKMLALFAEIENGKYDKKEITEFKLTTLKHPVFIRSIRADMQSFVNTFIDPYLDKKPYLADEKYIIDAGANIGYTAVLFANWWTNAEIISIEADFDNYELTVKNTASYPNIKVIHGGLWNKEIDLKIEAGQEDGFVVREINDKTGIKLENLTKGVSINSLMQTYNFPKIDFLKMNIEGSEKEIFTENYTEWLPKTKALLIELHDGKNAGCSKAVFNTTNQYDFAVAETSPYGILFVKENTYRKWYAHWYKEEIFNPNINKDRFPSFYLDAENTV
jgi:FkbM family methyltransferase